jgi:uncharacterized DUF497 family protein
MYIENIKVRYDEEKAKKVFRKHGVIMEMVRQEILAERFEPELVRNQRDHEGQRMFLVVINGYVVCVPFVEESDGTFFLKTAFKNRIYQRRYENGELRI